MGGREDFTEVWIFEKAHGGIAEGEVGAEGGSFSRGVLDEAVGKGAVCFDHSRHFFCGASRVVSGGGGDVLHEDGEGGGEASAEGDHGFRILPNGNDGAVGFASGSGGGDVRGREKSI